MEGTMPMSLLNTKTRLRDEGQITVTLCLFYLYQQQGFFCEQSQTQSEVKSLVLLAEVAVLSWSPVHAVPAGGCIMFITESELLYCWDITMIKCHQGHTVPPVHETTHTHTG